MSNLEPFATVDDLKILWRDLKESELPRAEELLNTVSHVLRVEAKKVKRDLDLMVKEDVSYSYVVKSVLVDIVARTLMTSTDHEPMTQYSESALGYSVSGSFLVPGGGLFIKDNELKRLGFKKQRFGVIDFYGVDKWN
ncbi:phage Gp19/Gp15/Gp42 family protein [Gemella morbillorum]|uniref:phage Gp19/Gp15/Gp42 family protein n=1 Tax=Gemella morbillorum TaxID=29391 RepID=UPI00248F1903|nr:phage Gp19/Gp15/Gp42 family protein [Gemella morbillorum]